MKTVLLAALFFGLFSSTALAQPDEKDAVTATLNNYILGSSYSDPARIKSAFYADADMFLDHPENPIYLMDPEKYANLFAQREQGVFNGRYGKILSIDIEGVIATAKAEILLPRSKSRYIDIFLLKKLDGEWKIISKAAGRADSPRTGEKFLLIATNKGMGEDFTDLITDYEAAVAAGYTVNIVSPNGGAILFNGLNMGNPKHRSYVYNADFMYALQHTPAAANVTAADYVAARYVQDTDAQKMTSGHAGVDQLYTAICAGENACKN